VEFTGRIAATNDGRPGAKWLAAGVVALLSAHAGIAYAQPADTPGCARPDTLVYVGDADFPPYEYYDENGTPAGFNVELMRALSHHLGKPIEIRLLPGSDARRARELGPPVLFSAGYVAARAEQFDFLPQTTTVRSSVLMRAGRASYPSLTSGFGGLRIAIQEGTPSLAIFSELPPGTRPAIVSTQSHRASVALLAGGQVDAVAGAGAALRWHAARSGVESFVEIPMSSRPYRLAIRKGCAAAVSDVAAALDRLTSQGVVEQIADHTIAPAAAPGLSRRALFAAGSGVALLFALALGWTWTLQRTVHARTIALSSAFAEQKRLADILRSNEDRLAFAMDVIGEGVWEWELDTGRLRASTRWAGSFGYAPEEAPTDYDSWMAYIHPEDRERVARAARVHIEGRAPRFEATYRVPRKNGDWIWVLDRGRIVRYDADGKPLRIVGALKDITVQLAAERALHEAKEAAEATSRAKSTFLATVSHEIRTPLNAVIGTASLLDSTPLDNNQRELVALVKRGGESLLAVVNDVLDFTKIESGRIELDIQPFALATFVNDTLALIEQAAIEKGLRLESRIDADSPAWVMGDVTRLRQILLNLLSNAIKFTTNGGVRVEVSSRPAAPGSSHVTIAVHDSGIGVPPDRIDRLFQPFTQVDSSTTRRFGGTGLGLAISQRLAELMGGALHVETAEGVGSTFKVALTLEHASAPKEPAVAKPAAAAETRLRVVLAEDNAVNQLVQRRMLRQLGCSCDVTGNGVELLAAVANTAYDVAILDIQMPEMDGLEAARQLRQRGHDNVFLIALTADVTTETRDSCLAAGFDEYLSKPVTAERLAAALARAMDREHLRA
jgi:PAS domain S-box-containing protein